MKIFDITGFINSGIINNDLKAIKKKYGQIFYIKKGDIKLPTKLYYNKKAAIKHYVLQYYDKKEEWTADLLPFKISFVNFNDISINNKSCYINNFHKTNDVSGSKIIDFTIYLLKKLGMKSALLGDGASIKCDYEKIYLSFFKLLEKNRTFYEKFGFKPYMTPGVIDPYGMVKYGKTIKENLKNRDLLVSTIKKIETIYYTKLFNKILKISITVIKYSDYDNIKLFIEDEQIIDKDRNEEKIIGIIKNCKTALEILNNSDKKYLYELLLELIYKDCSKYVKLLNSVFLWNIKKIQYKEVNIINKYKDVYDDLERIKWIYYKIEL